MLRLACGVMRVFCFFAGHRPTHGFFFRNLVCGRCLKKIPRRVFFFFFVAVVFGMSGCRRDVQTPAPKQPHEAMTVAEGSR